MKSKIDKKEEVKTEKKQVVSRKKISLTKKPAAIAKEVLMGLHNLKVPFGAHKKKKLLGRGPSSGHGKTSTRGSKGQTSRAGRHFYAGFEGGTSPLIRRMPKRGFTSKFKKEYQIVNLRDLNKIKDTNINLVLLEDKGLIKDKAKLVKILGEGEVKAPITVQAHAFSRKALKAITNAGGKTEIVNV